MDLEPPAPRPVITEAPAGADQPVAADAFKPRRRSRLPALFTGCLVVLVLVIATPAIYYMRESRRCAKYTPTGDELFDHYARAVIQRQAPRLFIRTTGSPSVATLPDAELAAWEDRFGDDPRYWQLRYLCTADLPEPEETTQPTLEASPGTKYLEEARVRGAVDFDTLYTLWRECYLQWSTAYDREQDDPEFQYYRDDPVLFERAMIERHGAEMQTLLDEMVAASPDESFPYYRRARYYFVKGEYDLALSDLKAGNAAPVNRMPGVFPVSFVRRGLSTGDELSNEYLSGAILLRGLGDGMEYYRAWRELGAGIQRLDAANQREWSAAYHAFACRFGQMEGADWIDKSVAGRMVRINVEEHLIERPAELTAAERRGLYKLALRANNVTLEYHLQSGLVVGDAAWAEHESLLPALSGSLIESDARSLQYANEYFAGEYRDIEGGFAGIFQRLAQFDYITMSWPEDGANAPFAGDFGAQELRTTAVTEPVEE